MPLTCQSGGGSACAACAAGRFSPAYAEVCSVCPAGRYAAMHATKCENCPEGQYSAEGASMCSNCASGAVASPDSTSCDAVSGPCAAVQIDAGGRGGFYVGGTTHFECNGESKCCANVCWQQNVADCGNTSHCGCKSGYWTTYATAP